MAGKTQAKYTDAQRSRRREAGTQKKEESAAKRALQNQKRQIKLDKAKTKNEVYAQHRGHGIVFFNESGKQITGKTLMNKLVRNGKITLRKKSDARRTKTSGRAANTGTGTKKGGM